MPIKQHGSILIEILVAFGLFSILFFVAFSSSSTSSELLKTISQMDRLEQKNSELLSLFLNTPQTSQPIQNETGGIFSSLTTEFTTPCLMSATANSKFTSSNTTDSQTVSTALTNELFNLGRDCTIYKQPKLTAEIKKYQLPPPANFTDIDILQINGADVAFLSSMEKGQADLWIVNLNAEAKLLASLETGKGTRQLDAVWIGSEPTVLATQYSSKNQLQTINVSNPEKPVLTGQYTLPKVGNSYPQGYSLFFYNDFVYVGTRETAGPELHKFDARNPNKLTHAKSTEVNHNIHGIRELDRQVFTTTSADKEELTIFNSDLQKIKTINLGGSTAGESDGTFIYMLGNNLLIGKNKIKDRSHIASLVTIKDTNFQTREIGATDLSTTATNTGLLWGSNWAIGGTTSDNQGVIIFGEFDATSTPQTTRQITTPAPVVKLETSNLHLYALLQNGELWQW